MAISRTNIILLTLLLGALGGLGYLSLRLDESEAENHRMAERQKELIARMEARAGTHRKPGSAVVMGPDGEAAANDGARKPEPNIGPSDSMERFAKFMHKSQLRLAWNQYHDAIAALNLPRETQLQLLNLLRARNEAMSDARDAAWKAGITDPFRAKSAEDTAANSVNEEITALIGAPGLESLNDSLELKNRRMQVERGVGADMAMDGIPLAPAQASALAQIYVDVTKRLPGDNSAPWDTRPAEVVLREQDQVDEAIMEKAALVLTPDQMADLKASIDMESQSRRLAVELNRQRQQNSAK